MLEAGVAQRETVGWARGVITPVRRGARAGDRREFGENLTRTDRARRRSHADRRVALEIERGGVRPTLAFLSDRTHRSAAKIVTFENGLPRRHPLLADRDLLHHRRRGRLAHAAVHSACRRHLGECIHDLDTLGDAAENGVARWEREVFV